MNNQLTICLIGESKVRDTIEAVVVDALKGKTKVPSFDRKMDLIHALNLDSVDILRIVFSLEEAFGIEFKDEDLDIGNFTSILSMEQLVTKYIKYIQNKETR